MNNEITELLYERGADIVRYADISDLPTSLTQGYKKAVVFCLALSRDFIIAMRDGLSVEHDEFVEKEVKADALADWLAEYLKQKGYLAYSQSEENNCKNGNFDVKTKSSKLPHKTIALLAGIGYIGKNNLLINDEYGCAICLCTVLTDAPIVTANNPVVITKCSDCDICKHICPENAIFGNEWSEVTRREGVIDVFRCTCTLKCMVYCPQTLKYALQT